MSPRVLTCVLVLGFSSTLLAGACAQRPPTESPPIETQDDDGDFGSDPEVGGSVGSDPEVGGSVGGDPAYSWSPPSGTPSEGDVGDSEPDPSAGSSGGDPPAWGYSPGNPIVSPGRQPAEPCDAKCEADYQDAAVTCGRMEDQARRRACQDSAYARYKSCRKDCRSAQKTCTDMFDDCWDRKYWPCNKWLKKEGISLCEMCRRNCEKEEPYKYKQCKQCGFSE
jgi:hypothetical protein